MPPRTTKKQRKIKVTMGIIGLVILSIGTIVHIIGEENAVTFIVGLVVLFIGLALMIFAILYDLWYGFMWNNR